MTDPAKDIMCHHVFTGHMTRPRVWSHLPPLGTFLGELGEVDRLLGILLPVFFSTRLHKKGVRRSLPLRLVGVFTHHGGSLAEDRGGKDETCLC